MRKSPKFVECLITHAGAWRGHRLEERDPSIIRPRRDASHGCRVSIANAACVDSPLLVGPHTSRLNGERRARPSRSGVVVT